MLIPAADAKDYGCPQTRCLPPEHRAGCAGVKCAAFVIVWSKGDFVANGHALGWSNPNCDARATYRAREPIGYCGLVHADHEALQREAIALHQDRLDATRPQETYLTPRPGSSTTSFFRPFPE